MPETVDAVVALCAGDADLEQTLRSLGAQRGVQVRVTLVAEPLAAPAAAAVLRAEDIVIAGGSRVGMWRAGLEQLTGELVLLVPAGAELDPAFTRRALDALSAEFDYATAFVARGRGRLCAPLGGDAVAATGIDAGASVALARRAALPSDATSERELWSGLAGVVLHEPLVRRLPRHEADPGEPAYGGGPSPEAAAAAFADVLSSDVPA